MTPTDRLLSVLGLLIFFIGASHSQLFEGDRCTIRGGRGGVCKPMPDCPAAIRDQRISRIRPTICSYSGITAVVCCEGTGGGGGGNQYTPSNNFNENINFNPNRPSRPNSRPSNGGFNSNGFSGNGQTGKRISELKCDEYSKQVTQELEALPLLPDPEPLSFTVPKCVHNSSPLIVGGQEVAVGEFPHMAAIGWGTSSEVYEFRCGGSLISENYVLTAAHCSNGQGGEPNVVRLGEHNLRRNDDGASPQDIAIDRVIDHPDYTARSKYNDLALLKLARPAEFNNFVRPACLWQNNNIQQNNAVATGWGLIGQFDEPSEVLLKVSLPFVSQDQCNSLLPKNKQYKNGIIEDQLCAGEIKGGKDTCQGDSGGPLQISNDENRCIFYVIGITSFGRGCGGINVPGVYTRVSSFIPWIERIVWANN